MQSPQCLRVDCEGYTPCRPADGEGECKRGSFNQSWMVTPSYAKLHAATARRALELGDRHKPLISISTDLVLTRYLIMEYGCSEEHINDRQGGER